MTMTSTWTTMAMTTETNIPTMPNNILVGSEKLFRTKSPFTINSSFIGQLSRDHRLLLFNTGNDKDLNRGKMSYLSLRLYEETQKPYNKMIFIGLDYECRAVVDLYQTKGFIFDCVVLINNPYSAGFYDSIYPHSQIYNFWTKTKNTLGYFSGAEVNQQVKTLLPAHMSNRLALEVSGTLTYGFYNEDYLQDIYTEPKYV